MILGHFILKLSSKLFKNLNLLSKVASVPLFQRNIDLGFLVQYVFTAPRQQLFALFLFAQKVFIISHW